MSNFGNRVPFPSGICPTSRRYTPGTLPTTNFQAQNGATTFVYFGRIHVNAKLELGFQNIRDDQASEIIEHYESIIEDAHVTFEGSQNQALKGMSQNLRESVEDGLTALRWKYDGPPQITSVYPGVSTVQCRFIGYLYGT